MAPAVGLEPTTDRLTADCSTTELRWNNRYIFTTKQIKLQVFFIIFCTFFVYRLIFIKNIMLIFFKKTFFSCSLSYFCKSILFNFLKNFKMIKKY